MIALDTNILVYASEDSDDPRRPVSMRLVEDAIALNHIIPVQVMAEYLGAIRRKLPRLEPSAPLFLQSLITTCQTPQSTPRDVIEAASLATRHRLQYFDALILTVAVRTGATTLYSEDMQDGLIVEALRVVNPFRSHSEA